MARIGLSGRKKPKHSSCWPLDGIIDPKEVPTDTKAAEWIAKDRKVYAYIFFLVEPNYRAPILDIRSGREAWNKLVSEHEKDNATTRIGLRQQFYSLSHNPSLSIVVFIDAVLSIARQLASIGHKLNDLEISDKLLIGLHQSWAPIRTALTLREKSEKPEVEKITAALKQFELAMSIPSVNVEELDNGELVLVVKSHGVGTSAGGEVRTVRRSMIGEIQRVGLMYVGDVDERGMSLGFALPICRKTFDHALTSEIDSHNPDEEFFSSVGHDPPGEFAW